MSRNPIPKRPRLDLPSPKSSGRISPPHRSAPALHLSHHPPQHSGTPIAVPAPVSATTSSGTFQSLSEPPSATILPPPPTPIEAIGPYQPHSLSHPLPHPPPSFGNRHHPPPEHPASAPPFVSHPPPGEPHAGYGVVDPHRDLSGLANSRPPTAGGHIHPTERRSTVANVTPIMDHPQGPPPGPHPVYGHSVEAHPVTSGPPLHGPNGIHQPYPGPMPTSSDQFQGNVPPGYHQYSGPYTNGAPWPHQRPPTAKKHQRAQIACNNCRARKQKCDEQTPSCSYCLQEKLTCEYRHVAPPKVDKNLLVIQEKQQEQADKIQEMNETLARLVNILEHQNPGAQHVPANTITTTSSPPQDTQIQNTEDIRVSETAPGSHSTGAHYLVETLPQTKAWFQAAGITAKNYPYEFETKQGDLRLFSHGWSGDDSVQLSDDRDEDIDAIYRPAYTDPPAERFNKGGLNPNGTLRLDAGTVRRLHDSYMHNMWRIYPIFDAQQLKQSVQHFIDIYSPASRTKPQTPPVPSSPRGIKRTHQGIEVEESEKAGHSERPKRSVDHSIRNAIILLVLANGSLCEHEDFLMLDELKDNELPFPPEVNTSQMSSPNFVRPSPTRSVGSHSSPKYPDNIINDNSSNESGLKLNVSKYPGLAYFVEACHILGEFYGSRNLQAAQAHLLAGLYWGQIGRITKSHSFIHHAAEIVVGSFKQFHEDDVYVFPNQVDARWNLLSPDKRNELGLFLIVFWTAQQAESDIAAELEELPSSQLDTLVKGPVNDLFAVCPPSPIGVSDPYSGHHELFRSHMNTGDIMMHFHQQLYLRRLLNRAHLALYSNETSKHLMGSDVNTWAGLTPDALWISLSQWREGLPTELVWSDNDPPSTDVLHARLRAKYYGAAFMINRKWLERACQTDYIPNLDIEHLRTRTMLDSTISATDLGLGARRCILAALKSTIAFDSAFRSKEGKLKRAKLPNIAGTFAAQFCNMLLLSSAYSHEQLQHLVPDEFYAQLLRTIGLLHHLSPVSPVFATNKKVLLQAWESISNSSRHSRRIKMEPGFDLRNAMYQSSWVVNSGQPNYGSPGAHSSRTLSATPSTSHHSEVINSAPSSFAVPR